MKLPCAVVLSVRVAQRCNTLIQQIDERSSAACLHGRGDSARTKVDNTIAWRKGTRAEIIDAICDFGSLPRAYEAGCS